MKVFHCPSQIGGNPAVLAKHERELGLDSISISEKSNYIGQSSDSLLSGKNSGLLNLEVQRIQNEQRLSAIEQQKVIAENEYNQVIQQEAELLNNLNEKYGQGSLDLEKGVFTPIEEKK